MKTIHRKPAAASKIGIVGNKAEPFLTIGSDQGENRHFWRWGSDNLFPCALALMSRRSTTHRRIINDKADYISGRGFSFDPDNRHLQLITEKANGSGETLRQVLNRLAFDKALFGNAFLEVATDPQHSFLSLFHQDASKCRIARDDRHVLLHHDWMQYAPAQARKLPLYPLFSKAKDGTLRSVIHYKDYEPMFEHYGIPSYIAGMNVSAIAYKTDQWNISRLDNSFQLSGVMVLDAGVDSEEEAFQIIQTAEKRFAGRPGQVMFMVKNSDETENSKFIPMHAANEGDWKQLHEQATSDIVVAHSWFRSLSGLDYNSNFFSSERILHEYDIALNTVILGEQAELLEPIRMLLGNVLQCDTSSLEVINRPPAKAKPLYMKVWEARKNDGLDYDSQDPQQNLLVAQITKYAMRNID